MPGPWRAQVRNLSLEPYLRKKDVSSEARTMAVNAETVTVAPGLEDESRAKRTGGWVCVESSSAETREALSSNAETALDTCDNR